MKLYQFCLFFGLMKFYQISEAEDDEKFSALLAVRKENRYELAVPTEYESDSLNTFKYPISKEWKSMTYYLCPDGNKQDHINFPNKSKLENLDALYVKQVTIENPKDDVKCYTEIKPKIIKVIKDRSKYESLSEDIILFRIGFQIYNKDIKQPAFFTFVKNCIDASCLGGGKEVSEKLLLDKEFDFIPLISIYFNTTTQLVIAVHYEYIMKKWVDLSTVATTSLPYLNDKSYFFNRDYYDTIIDDLNYQKQLFEKIFGKTQNYVTDDIYFVGHPLVSEKDFIAPIWKNAARYKIYLELMWNLVLPKWKDIENICKAVAEEYNNKIFITTGISGILMLHDDNNELKSAEIQEDNKKIRFPALFWKLIENKDKDKKMLIIMSNNPFEKEEKICNDFCAQFGLLITNQDHTSGLTYCCNLSQKISDNIEIRQILQDIENTESVATFNYSK